MFHASCCIHAQVNTLLQKASQLSCISKVATCWLAKSGKATSCVGSTKLASSLSGSHSRTMAFLFATPSWHSLLCLNIAYMFLLSWYSLISQNNLALLTFTYHWKILRTFKQGREEDMGIYLASYNRCCHCSSLNNSSIYHSYMVPVLRRQDVYHVLALKKKAVITSSLGSHLDALVSPWL